MQGIQQIIFDVHRGPPNQRQDTCTSRLAGRGRSSASFSGRCVFDIRYLSADLRPAIRVLAEPCPARVTSPMTRAGATPKTFHKAARDIVRGGLHTHRRFGSTPSPLRLIS
jgi:hypothetical protein